MIILIHCQHLQQYFNKQKDIIQSNFYHSESWKKNNTLQILLLQL